METTYKITQHVKSAIRGWDVIVFQGEIKRLAEAEFNELQKEYPDGYFELIEVEYAEKCLKWT